MPTTIAIEAKNVSLFGVESPYQHLYLVKTVTDASGRVIDERVIRGDVGADFTLVTQADIRLAGSLDARGSETPAERHRTELDLGGRDPEAVWRLMVQHVANIDKADRPYGTGVDGNPSRSLEVNSNTTVASALYTVGIDLAETLPAGIAPRDVPLYDRVGFMLVDDALVGSVEADIVRGGMGTDRIEGQGGDDRLEGGFGNDTLVGGTGNDLLSGGEGNDRLHGGSGHDRIEGGSGSDRMTGGSGNDLYRIDSTGDSVVENRTETVYGVDRIVSKVGVNLAREDATAGVERLSLGGSADLDGIGNALANLISGNGGQNVLSGKDGDDRLSGRANNDILRGGSGNDRLDGGTGNDEILGGSGQDHALGGSGSDVFLYLAVSESRAGETGRDTIGDFSAQDVIDLKAVDANALASGNQTFDWIGSAAFTGAGQLRFEQTAGSTLIQGDVDGDRVADFEILLGGFTGSLTDRDFVL